MHILDRFISRRAEMPEKPDELARLRETHYTLEDLPDSISFPKHPDGEADAALSLEQATIDDIAFAIVAAEQERTTAYRRSSALERLYKLAREAGGRGADLAVKSALKRETD